MDTTGINRLKYFPKSSHNFFIVFSGTGTAARLAEITKEDETLSISNHTNFLESAELITGAILVSTAPCQLVGLSIRVNASIRETNTG